MPATAPYAALLLRVTMGVLFLAHAFVWKIWTAGMVHVVPWFVSQGYPAWFAWFVTGLEALGGILLILGWQTRWVALVLAGLMVGIVRQQFGNGWIYSSTHGGWEYPAFWGISLIALAMLGPGALAWKPRLSRASAARQRQQAEDQQDGHGDVEGAQPRSLAQQPARRLT